MKISNFIIALVIVGVVATTFSMLIINLDTKYYTGYENSTLSTFEETSTLKTLAYDLENKTNSQNSETGILDLVGSYIGRALDAVKLSRSSFGVFESMTATATEKIGLPRYFMDAFITIMLILIVLGVIVTIMVKWAV